MEERAVGWAEIGLVRGGGRAAVLERGMAGERGGGREAVLERGMTDEIAGR